MQVWNLLQAVCWKHRTQKSHQKSPSGHHRTTLLGYIFGMYQQSEKNLLNSNTSSTCPDNMVNLRPTNGWDLLVSLNPCKFQRVLCLGSVTARNCSSGRQPYFAALNRGRHLSLAGPPSVGHWPTFLVISLIFIWCGTLCCPLQQLNFN